MRSTRVRASRRIQPRLAGLERRASASVWPDPTSVLTALAEPPAVVASNLTESNRGIISDSQYQPWGFALLGYQWRDVALRGTLAITKRFPFNRATTSVEPTAMPISVVNAGSIASSQFNVGGFSQIGMQWRGVTVGGSIRIDDYDESYGQDRDGGAPVVAGDGGARPGPVPLPTPVPVPDPGPTNTGTVQGSQFNDGGFGNVGLQWSGVTIGGDANLNYRAYIRYPDGRGPTPSSTAPEGAVTPTQPDGTGHTSTASVNTGLIENNQFNDGGFGNVGMQWRDTVVNGSMNVSYETWTVQPQPTLPQASSSAYAGAGSLLEETSANETNRGHLVNQQFSDGGFGDIGYQWQDVKVGGSVATSYNGLSIQPELAGVGPISIANLNLGQAGAPAPNPFLPQAVTAQAAGGPSVGSTASAGSVATSAADSSDNSTTNSGVVVNTQFSDGGFGDIGAQWRRVTVGGNVEAVHNSLSIQPENSGQGMISVAGIVFPSSPWKASTAAPEGASRTLAADPVPMSDQGGTPGPLPTPTGYRDRSFAANHATNSGPIEDSQFSDGGFGDIGLQWANVTVGGSVRLVHNSLSIQPEGSDLEGVVVSGVRFGGAGGVTAAAADAGTGSGRASLRAGRVAGRSQPINRTIRPPRAGAPYWARLAKQSVENPPAQRRGPSNARSLTGRQTANSLRSNVTLQWLNSYQTPDELVIVHNVLAVHAWGRNTGPIVLDDVQFAANTPRVNGLMLASTRYLAQSLRTTDASAQAAPRGQTARRRGAVGVLQGDTSDAATNSGRLTSTQFSDGGFGDVGLQLRDVSIGGDVNVIHNSLSINITGDNTGSIRVENVSFASGVLDGLTPTTGSPWIVPPPVRIQRNWGADRGEVTPLPAAGRAGQKATNSGIVTGGQFSDGGFGDIAVQAAGVEIPGQVTIIHNVLEVQTAGDRTGPIRLSGIRFE